MDCSEEAGRHLSLLVFPSRCSNRCPTKAAMALAMECALEQTPSTCHTGLMLSVWDSKCLALFAVALFAEEGSPITDRHER